MATSPRTRDVAAMREVVKRIKSVDDFSPFAKVCVFGPNGGGKTRFTASAPKPLILDINEGEGTRSTVGSGARVIEITDWNDVPHIYWYLQSMKHRYQSVGLDGATGLYRLALDFVIDDADRRNPARPGKQPDKRDYGRANELFSGMCFAFRNLPMHVIFTARERTIREEDTGLELETTLNLPAGARGALMDMVGILGFMSAKRAKRDGKVITVSRLQVGPSDQYPTKDRTGNLPTIITNPTMAVITKAWSTIDSEED